MEASQGREGWQLQPKQGDRALAPCFPALDVQLVTRGEPYTMLVFSRTGWVRGAAAWASGYFKAPQVMLRRREA